MSSTSTDGKYRMLEQIGAGGEGRVFKGEELRTGELVALKQITSEQKVKYEQGILHQLHHENVIMFKGTAKFQDVQGIFMVYEYMDHDLAGLMARRQLEASHIKCLLFQVLDGLNHCHDNSIIHRDIKPANILVSCNGVVKLADFGLARKISGRDLSSRIGTLAYRSPEMLLGSKSYGLPSDMWSVGCTIAEVYLQHRLFTGCAEDDPLQAIFRLCGSPDERTWPGVSTLPYFDQREHMRRYEGEMGTYFEGLPGDVVDVLTHLLVLDPNQRWTARDVLRSTYFSADPLPCLPSEIPKFSPSRVMTTGRYQGPQERPQFRFLTTVRQRIQSSVPQSIRSLHHRFKRQVEPRNISRQLPRQGSRFLPYEQGQHRMGTVFSSGGQRMRDSVVSSGGQHVMHTGNPRHQVRHGMGLLHDPQARGQGLEVFRGPYHEQMDMDVWVMQQPNRGFRPALPAMRGASQGFHAHHPPVQPHMLSTTTGHGGDVIWNAGQHLSTSQVGMGFPPHQLAVRQPVMSTGGLRPALHDATMEAPQALPAHQPAALPSTFGGVTSHIGDLTWNAGQQPSTSQLDIGHPLYPRWSAAQQQVPAMAYYPLPAGHATQQQSTLEPVIVYPHQPALTAAQPLPPFQWPPMPPQSQLQRSTFGAIQPARIATQLQSSFQSAIAYSRQPEATTAQQQGPFQAPATAHRAQLQQSTFQSAPAHSSQSAVSGGAQQQVSHD